MFILFLSCFYTKQHYNYTIKKRRFHRHCTTENFFIKEVHSKLRESFTVYFVMRLNTSSGMCYGRLTTNIIGVRSLKVPVTKIKRGSKD